MANNSNYYLLSSIVVQVDLLLLFTLPGTGCDQERGCDGVKLPGGLVIARATRSRVLINSSFSAQNVQKYGKICRIFQHVGVFIAFSPNGKYVLKHFVQWKATPEDNSPHTVNWNCTLTDFVHSNDTLDGKCTFYRSSSQPTGLSRVVFPNIKSEGWAICPPRLLVLRELEEPLPGCELKPFETTLRRQLTWWTYRWPSWTFSNTNGSEKVGVRHWDPG